MKSVYFITGLGASIRSFHFLDVSFCKAVLIELPAIARGEKLENYAMKVRKLIPEEHPTVVGLSFGGMLAVEMAKQDPLMQAIIISSIRSSREFPGYLRAGIYLPLYRWMPGSWQKQCKNIFQGIIGRTKGEAYKQVQDLILKESNPKVTSAIIDMVLRWKSDTIPPNIIHIHGTADRTLPYRKVTADHTIEGGTHLMIMDRAEEISVILKQVIMEKDSRISIKPSSSTELRLV
jgi:pimeloyl-ACP methyl ester carboxylesterase